MPIFYDRIADQIEELLPEFYQEDGPRFVSFIKAYFEFLEKGQLIYKDAADIDYIGLEDGTVAGETFNKDGQRGNLLQEPTTYAPSSIASAKFNYEYDVDSGVTVDGEAEYVQVTSFENGEYVVGASTGAVGRIEVIGNSSNLYIEQFSEAQFDIDETITGKTSGMTAKVASFKASPLHAANNLLSYADVDKTSGDFIEYFRRDFMPFIDRDVLANKRLLQKHVKELYLSKGTKESYEFLFRILYGMEAEVVFPGDNVIKPSESEFSEPTVMRLYSASDVTKYKRGLIKKIESGVVVTKAYINDASGMSGTDDGVNGYEIELVTPFTGTFNVGDTVILSDRDGFRIDAEATVRGLISDIDPNESGVYVGLEDGSAGDIEDIIRLESSTSIYILDEDGDNILMEDESELIFEHAIGGEKFQAISFELETATGIGQILLETSVYDQDNNLTTDHVLVYEQTDLYEASGDPLWKDGPATRTMGGGLYEEGASLGALYEESDTFNYNSPQGGSATQSINVIGGIGRGTVTDIIVDDVGTGYSEGDKLVFVNADTGGDNAEAEIKTTRAFVSLEAGTLNENTVYSYTATANQTVFSGRDDANLIMGFDPRKVKVYVNGTEKTRETQFTTDQSGGKITLTSGASANDVVEVYAAFQGMRLEDADNPNPNPKSGHPDNNYITQETDSGISRVRITHPGENYKSLPKVFMGGYIYYDTISTGTTVSPGDRIGTRYSGATPALTLTVVKHDTVNKRILVYKLPTDAAGVPTGQVKYPATGTASFEFTVLQTDVTNGNGAKLWAFGENIGSVKKLKMQDVGHKFEEGGIGNYKQHAVLQDVSANPTVNTTVTANLTGSTANVNKFDSDRNILTLNKVRGIFNEGDYCTTSDSKNFIVGKINAATARGKLNSIALYDGNYLDDKGFPSVDSQRIHDSQVYQDYSYKIKVGKSINDYRSLVKSLLSPAGTIMFGEVSIRNTVDAKAAIYDRNFDGVATTRSFIPTLIIGSRVDTADLIQEDGTIPGGILGLNQLTLTGTGAAGVYTGVTPQVPSGGSGVELTLEVNANNTSYQNLLITSAGTGYTAGETVTITQEMVGGSGETVFATFEIESVGESHEAVTDEVFIGDSNRFKLETEEGIVTTERFLCTDATATNHSTHTVQDQASGQPYILGTDAIEEKDKDFFARQLVAEAIPLGSRVHKELDIFPAYNQHKIYYSTLNNALAVGTKVRGATSNALGIVMQHDTTNKFIIVHRDQEDWGAKGSQFSGTEIIQNTAASTNYFTGTSIELNWTPEDIVTKREPAAITADTTITSANQKISNSVEGGGDAYDHADYLPGFQGRGKVLVASDHSETYDSEMKQRKVTIISSPIYSSSATQSGRTLSAGNNTRTPLNQKGAESYAAGDLATTVRTTTIVAGDTAPPYLAINGTSLRLDDIKNSVSELPGDSTITVLQDTGRDDSNSGRTTNRTGVNISSGVNWGYRPAGQKLYESTNFVSERIISEAGETFIMEDNHGRVMGEYFGQGGIVLLEDDTTLLWETATIVDDTHYFVSEESTQVGSFNIISEAGERLIDETNSLPLLHEEALMIGQKESNQAGPSIGDLRDMMFTENYSIMQKVQLDGGSGISSGDDLLLETGEHLIQESLSEGIKISDISSIYPNRLINDLQREYGRKTNLTHSAVIQTG